jgi:hypothetical protein
LRPKLRLRINMFVSVVRRRCSPLQIHELALAIRAHQRVTHNPLYHLTPTLLTIIIQLRYICITALCSLFV